MDCAPIYRQLVLQVQSELDVQFAKEILNGNSTISQIAEVKGQDRFTFYADGDVLVLAYDYDLDRLNEADAMKCVKDLGNLVLRNILIPAIGSSRAPIELVFKFCNLSTETIIFLSEAVRSNHSFVGFACQGNPGNCEIGEIALKYACVRSKAPIRWFQGVLLDDSLVEARRTYASMDIPVNNQVEEKHAVASPTQEHKEQDESPGVTMRKKYQPDTIVNEDTSLLLTPRREQVPTKMSCTKEPPLKRAANQPKVTWNDRELWRLEMCKLVRTMFKIKNEAEVDAVVTNLELYELHLRIDYILSGLAGTSVGQGNHKSSVAWSDH